MLQKILNDIFNKVVGYKDKFLKKISFNISETNKIKDNLVRIRYNSVNNNRTFEREREREREKKNRLISQFTGTYRPKKIKRTLL